MPLLWVSLAFITGTLLGSALPLRWFVWVSVAVLGLAATLIEKARLTPRPGCVTLRARVPLPPGVLLLFLALGALRLLSSLPNLDDSDLAYYNDKGTYTLIAVVSAPPDRREDAVYLEVRALEIEDPLATEPSRVLRSIRGKARARLAPGADWAYGDLLRFTAEPLTPSDDSDFSYKDFLSRQGIHTAIYYPKQVEKVGQGKVNPILLGLENLRQKARSVIFRQFPQPESGLLAGILLGLDNDLPDSLEEAYRSTGTAHIIAISGFNMTVVAGAILFFASRLLNRYRAAALTSVVLVLYTLFVGGSPSVIRAAIMAVAAFGGHLIGRRQVGLNALGFTAALMCLVNPGLTGDASFQLSFAATLGLVIFGNPLQEWADKLMEKRLDEEQAHRISRPLSQFFLFTLAAQLTTLPIIAAHFGRISLSSLLANPLVLPAQPAVLILGGLSTLAGMVLPAFGKILAIVVWPILAYTNRVVEWLAQSRLSSLTLHPQAAVWILVSLVLFLLVFLFRNYFKKLFKWNFHWIVLLLILACAAAWSIALHQPDGRLHLLLLRTGDQSALMLLTPEGKTIVFDPGDKANELSAAVSREISPWNFDIDQVWLSSRASAGALDQLIERIPVRQVVLPPSVYQAAARQSPLELPPGIKLVKLNPSTPFPVEADLRIEVVAEDTSSAAFYLVYRDLRVLIPNGVDYALIREVNPSVLSGLTVLILAPDDLSYIPPRVWTALEPAVILWNSTALSPDPAWPGLDAGSRVEFTTDGSQYVINTGK